jgi:uncharacterized protein (TIGR02145 family)
VKRGFVNGNYVYVYENFAYRIGTELDYSLGFGGCTYYRAHYKEGASRGTLSQTAGGVYYMCAEADTIVNGYKVTSAWRLATDTEVDTYGWEEAWGWTKCFLANSNRYYVFETETGSWREPKKLECKDGLAGCIGYNYGLLAKNADDVVYRCEKTGWELGSSFDIDVYGFYVGISDACIASETGSHHVYSTGINGGFYEAGQLVPGHTDSTYMYVCDDKNARRATKLEVFVGKGCTVYNKDEEYATETTDYKCSGSRWDVVKGSLNTGRPGEKVYKTVRIGESIWMGENLNYRYTYPTMTLDSSSYCYLDNCEKYGRYYLLSAAFDSAGIIHPDGVGKGCGNGADCENITSETKVQGICPDGWHIPTKAEAEYLVGLSDKATDFMDSTQGSDRYGFSLVVGTAVQDDDGEWMLYNGSESGTGEADLTTSYLYSWVGTTYTNVIYFLYFSNTNQNYAKIAGDYRKTLTALRCIRDKLASEEPYR